jgi:hypothetical protein
MEFVEREITAAWMRIDNGVQYWPVALGTWVVGIKGQGHREAPFAVGDSSVLLLA